MLKKASSIASCMLLSACMVGPNYKEPPKPVVTQWKKDKSIKETPLKTVLWWTVFKDPVLTKLIQQGYQSNLSLQSAGAKVLQARAQLAQSVGQLYPQQQALGSNYTYYRIGGSSLQGLLPSQFNAATLGFTANWEIDFWGKYRRAIQSNNAAFLASYAAYDSALVTLTADIASTYVKIRTVEGQINVTKENIVVQKMALRIATTRFKEGETSLVDVEQAQTELASTEANLPALANKLQQQKDILTLLLGTVPNAADKTLKQGRGIPKAPNTVAVGIPKEALARRPDIFQAREQAVAQSELIGAAKANLFPSFALVGTFAFSANNIGTSSVGDLFNWANRTITAGPSASWPILNYGQITNAVRSQDAAFQQALLNYINAVLQAQKEVQDAITSYIEAKKAVLFFSQASASAQKTLKLTLIRYEEGESDFTPVLNAEQQQLKVQNSLVQAQGDIPVALIALYRALGGGWQIRGQNDLVSPQIKKAMATRTNWGSLLEEKNHALPKTKGQEIKQLYLPNW